METIYIILVVFVVMALLIGLITTVFYFDREKNKIGENCEYDPYKKIRPCCKQKKEIDCHSLSG